MTSYLATAASFFARTNLSANYTIDEAHAPAQVGLWKVFRATRNVTESSANTNARNTVSVWSHTLNSRGRERSAIVDQLKKEASTLTRLRHPCILEVVEPLEETRSEITFATELVQAPLSDALVADNRSEILLDEVETQKGLLQVARGLEFLHGASMVHGNLVPEAVLINAKGDWKLALFSFLTPLKGADGTPTPFAFPDYDPSLPPAMSRNFDFMAPEFALDEQLLSANDMYSLGCLVFAAHNKGNPPFRNRNSLTNLRQNADQLSTVIGSSAWSRMDREVLDLIGSLLTRYPGSRLQASSFGSSSYFASPLVNTLKFMERENFAARSKEERVQFLKGLLTVLPSFSDRLLRRKVLPALTELMNDTSLLPFILPNVFHISKALSSIEFTSSVLPRLKTLFAVQDPPANQLMLLDQIELFMTKTSPSVFREEVTPLLYSALEAEQAMVQERALQTVPRLCEVLEYAHIKEITFPKLAVLFAKTKVLSVKCNTLICFHSMIDVLDKFTLTEKLVPILARIKTREPSVMVATLAVHEALSKKVDRETLATAIIPQLWVMSMGPLLNADQFQRFMRAVKEMGTRVEAEQLQHLQEQKRMQEHTESHLSHVASRPDGASGAEAGSAVDFATLIGSGKNSGTTVARDANPSASDPFGFDDLVGASTASPSGGTPTLTPSHTGLTSPAPRTIARVSTSITPSIASQTFTSAVTPPPALSSASRPIAPPPSNSRPSFSAQSSLSSVPMNGAMSRSSPLSQPAPPPGWGSTLTPIAASNTSSSTLPSSTSLPSAGPNYNISLSPASNWGNSVSATSTPSLSFPTALPAPSSLPAASPPPQPLAARQTGGATMTPSWDNVLAPTKKSSIGAANKQPDLSDFDPFK